MTDKPQTPIGMRFIRYVHFCDSGCWDWTGAKNEHGYGVIGRGRRGDWGGLLTPGDTLTIRIFQLSALTGRGAAKTVTLAF